MGKYSLKGSIAARFARLKNKKNLKLKTNRKINLAAITLLAVGSFFYAWNGNPEFYAHTYKQDTALATGIDLKAEIEKSQPLLEGKEAAGEKKDNTNSAIQEKLYVMVGEAPIKEMVPYIAQHEQTVAALIVGIAKKESSWGEHAPTLDGKDCFNYWGYKGAGSRGTAMGYGCFASPEEGVNVIGSRIGELVGKNLTTPSKMVVWKCGSSCAGHDPVAVKKWITDVDAYFSKIVAFAG